MGIYDRDWYRDMASKASKSRGPTTRPASSHNQSTGWPRWLIWPIIIVLGAVAAKFTIESSKDLPFPTTGQVHWYADRSAEARAELTIIPPADDTVKYVVHLDDWETKSPVAMIPIRGGETAKTQVPLGRYRLTMTKGMGWRGPSKLFRYNVSAKEATEPLEFYVVNQRIVGHTIRLETLIGNMGTQPASRR